ncbi:MAG TPA: hypothetical protein VF463_04075, partial [Sphingobium sp.]
PPPATMRTALYYPHTEVRSRNVIHTALLLWDNLEYIAPFEGYSAHYEDVETAEAMEIIGRKRVPSESEKGQVHALIEDLIARGVPATFRYEPASGTQDHSYEMWPQKLLHETWDLLRDAGLTDRHLDNRDYPMSQSAGLSVMAILADVLAGETRSRITDRSLAYATIANAAQVDAGPPNPARVVPLTFKGIAYDRLPIDRLIDFRKREAREGGSDYRKFRHNYLEAVEKHLARITRVDARTAHRAQLDEEFRIDMEDDLADLKKELGFARTDAWLSKEVVALAIAGGTLFGAGVGIPHIPVPEVLTASGSLAMLGGLLGSRNKLAKARYDVLRKHPMAYLHELSD